MDSGYIILCTLTWYNVIVMGARGDTSDVLEGHMRCSASAMADGPLRL